MTSKVSFLRKQHDSQNRGFWGAVDFSEIQTLNTPGWKKDNVE